MSLLIGSEGHLKKRKIRTSHRYRAYGVWLPARIGDRHALMVASILALVDLKRAGFRYGHGELSIPSQETVRSIQGPEPFSYCGSPAALCAQEGDESAIGLHAPRLPQPNNISIARLPSIGMARRRARKRRARK
jgi:hypothetical protein